MIQIDKTPLLDLRLRPIISKEDCVKRIAEIFSFIKENTIKLLFIKSFNKGGIPPYPYHFVIIGRKDDNLFILDSKNNIIFYNSDILNNPWLGYTFKYKYGRFSIDENFNWNKDTFFENNYLMMDTINNQDKSDLYGYTKESPTFNKIEIEKIKILLKKPGKDLSEIYWDKLLLSTFDNCKPIENIDEYEQFQLLNIQDNIIEPYNLKFDKIEYNIKSKLEKKENTKYLLCKKKV